MNNYNVIFIGIDTLRADHLGCYGYRRPTSPNIDALAKEGVLFKNCFSQAPITAPSFMSIFTSRYPSYHGVLSNIGKFQNYGRAHILDRRIPVFTEVLRQNDYCTAAFTDGANLYDKLGFSRGFDYYSMNLDRRRSLGGIPREDIFYWLKEHARKKFFLFFHTYTVHNPWFAPKPYQKLFNPDYMGPLRKTILRATLRKRSIRISPYHYFLSKIRPDDPEDIFHFKALYDGAIKYIDDFVAALIDNLNELGIAEKTIVVFTSDHGEEFREHGQLSHQQFYDELLHIPLIITSPHCKKATVIDQIIRGVDIAPTVLELLDIKTSFIAQGVSLMPTLKQDLNLTAIAETERHGYSVRTKKYKYIFPRYKNYPHLQEKTIDNLVDDEVMDELYDLENDPEEYTNIAINNPDVVEKKLCLFDEELHRVSLSKPRRKIIYLGLSSAE